MGRSGGRTTNQREAILDCLRRAWELKPDERLCQLIVNATRQDDPFYVEDSDLIGHLARYTTGGDS